MLVGVVAVLQELILTAMKKAGYVTLMCGDGTNDVGALKQAHVGTRRITSRPLSAQARPLTRSAAKTAPWRRCEQVWRCWTASRRTSPSLWSA